MSESVLIRRSSPPPRRSSQWIVLLVGILAVGFAAFLLLPGSIASKTHFALHGICAQRPSHSLQIGGSTLPLDARMTGVYIGAVCTALWFLAAGRGRSAKLPPRSVLVVLSLFVILLAADGFNALAFDLGVSHPYPPSNFLRLATGILGGTTLGLSLLHLFATSLWIRANRVRPVVSVPTELLPPIAIAGVVGLVAVSGLPILYAPFAIGLVVVVLGVFTALIMITVALLTNRGWSYPSFRAMAALACTGVIAATLFMASTAWLRLAMEARFPFFNMT